ncbi:heparinase II/III family protein [Brachybacterium sp. FME24]|uniref:heparinase II/III family protein n=1 Tax=Brachybacterium sp. FME24 TaxID=2742605 RepID=UPI0018678B59|nr:heparinase II/III family protein [Brachybacterium sp. FME24]
MVNSALTPLRSAWGLPVDHADVDGIGPDAAARATLPAELSAAFDGAREQLAVPRLSADGTPPPLSEAIREAMTAPALASRAEPLPFPLLSQYARYWREGVRTDHEDDVRRLGIMAGEAVLAAVATGEQRWIDRAADGLLLLCELSTWCWVAHEEVHRRRGWVLPDPDEPVVDLGAAQTLHVLAWADLTLGASLDERVPGLRERMRREARRRVIDPSLERRDWHWLHGEVNNWTGWIHQHLIAGALLLMDREEDRRTRDAVLALAIAQQDRYLASFPADGGIDEGFNYFWNGASRLLEAIDMLAEASGGLLPARAAADVPVIAELVRYPHRMELGEGWFVNVSDGPARPGPHLPWGVTHRWGLRLGDAEVVAGALAQRGGSVAPPLSPESGLGRVLLALGDEAWRTGRRHADGGEGDGSRGAGALADPAPPLPAETWLPQVQLLVARERAGDARGLALAAKGGHNAESHNHLDVGSVMVALDSSPVLIDLGQPTYRAHTFTQRRYEIWTMISSWHTLPTIGGLEQGVGSQFRAEVVQAPDTDPEAAGPEDSALTLDLAAAYPAEAGVRSFRRRALLQRGADAVGAPDVAGSAVAEVRIEDCWQLEPGHAAPGAAAVTAHHVLAGDLLEHEAGLLRVRALSGSIAELTWDMALGAGDLERRLVEDPLLESSWGEAVHRLRLHPLIDRATGVGRLTLTLRAER